MTLVFIVRAETRGCPESYICGVYPTAELAQARVDFMLTDGMDLAWYDEVKVGPDGADCMLCNR